MKKAYVFIFSTIFVLFSLTSSKASYPKVIWHAGHVELWDRTDLEGDLSYNWAAEMVSIRQEDGRVRTFSANQVARFGWFDYSQHKLRNFVALANPADKGLINQVFYEVCMDGSLTVVRRLRQSHGLLKRLLSHPTHATDQPSLTENIDLFDYFVYDAGRLLALNRFYTDIYEPLMTTFKKEIRQYVQTHNINDRLLPGRLLLIDRYNWFVQHDSKAASVKGVADAPN
ncbi:hypothetical protein [Spirosoma radiotolerans]|uniref:Uncharacterized protein n=1 Tax=Spirosoma radiotolerans TaxID=1379870 RepID=A0A0E3ZXG2_9BACT|nr:hypothetical protein [Spirosoma radiotolerans]AKD57080.1 hypothetical protein SD10_21475 [Spirosoma radiotolerans]